MPGPGKPLETELTKSVIAVNPLHRSSPRLAAVAARAGAPSVLELPARDPRGVADTLERTCRWSTLPFGVRIRPGCTATVADLPDLVDTVLLADPGRSPEEFAGRRVLVEVTDLAGALHASGAGAGSGDRGRAGQGGRAAGEGRAGGGGDGGGGAGEGAGDRGGAAGLIVRGAESGGRAGELSTFVLLQQVLADPSVTLPVWVCGGIGPHTAATVAGGAAGVVLDTQLALYDDAGPPTGIAGALAGLDGSETVLHHGMRVLRRRGPGAPELPYEEGEFEDMIGGDDLRTQPSPSATMSSSPLPSPAAGPRWAKRYGASARRSPPPSRTTNPPPRRPPDRWELGRWALDCRSRRGR